MTHDKKWKTGDTVKLASGGPGMTVEDIDDDDTVVCTFFDKDHKMQVVRVKHAMLVAWVAPGP